MKIKKFWLEKKLYDLDHDEWESLCDNCGKCCLIKLQNEENNELFYTNVSCKLLNTENCIWENTGNQPIQPTSRVCWQTQSLLGL